MRKSTMKKVDKIGIYNILILTISEYYILSLGIITRVVYGDRFFSNYKSTYCKRGVNIRLNGPQSF